MDESLGALGTSRGLALTLSVLYHGLSCLADTSVPAKSGTVIDTAKKFEQYLDED